jgi:hypothetical protein
MLSTNRKIMRLFVTATAITLFSSAYASAQSLFDNVLSNDPSDATPENVGSQSIDLGVSSGSDAGSSLLDGAGGLKGNQPIDISSVIKLQQEIAILELELKKAEVNLKLKETLDDANNIGNSPADGGGVVGALQNAEVPNPNDCLFNPAECANDPDFVDVSAGAGMGDTIGVDPAAMRPSIVRIRKRREGTLEALLELPDGGQVKAKPDMLLQGDWKIVEIRPDAVTASQAGGPAETLSFVAGKVRGHSMQTAEQ